MKKHVISLLAVALATLQGVSASQQAPQQPPRAPYGVAQVTVVLGGHDNPAKQGPIINGTTQGNWGFFDGKQAYTCHASNGGNVIPVLTFGVQVAGQQPSLHVHPSGNSSNANTAVVIFGTFVRWQGEFAVVQVILNTPTGNKPLFILGKALRNPNTQQARPNGARQTGGPFGINRKKRNPFGIGQQAEPNFGMRKSTGPKLPFGISLTTKKKKKPFWKKLGKKKAAFDFDNDFFGGRTPFVTTSNIEALASLIMEGQQQHLILYFRRTKRHVGSPEDKMFWHGAARETLHKLVKARKSFDEKLEKKHRKLDKKFRRKQCLPTNHPVTTVKEALDQEMREYVLNLKTEQDVLRRRLEVIQRTLNILERRFTRRPAIDDENEGPLNDGDNFDDDLFDDDDLMGPSAPGLFPGH